MPVTKHLAILFQGIVVWVLYWLLPAEPLPPESAPVFPQTFEQPCPVIIFQLLEVFADAGLGKVQLFCSTGKVEVSGRCMKDCKTVEVHAYP